MNLTKSILAFTLVFVLFSCEKSEQYVPVPYTCECGRITWEGIEHQVTGVSSNFLEPDSLGLPDHNTRKYDLTVSIKNETDITETEAHHVNTIFEFPDISNIFYYIYSDTTEIDTSLIDTSIVQPRIFIEEVNFNIDAIPSIIYKAVDGTLKVNVSDDGLNDEVDFNLNIKKYDGVSTFGSAIPYSGTFTVTREQ